jgi:hypothetical protein
MRVTDFIEPILLFEAFRADHDPVGSFLEQLNDPFRRADAAAHLHCRRIIGEEVTHDLAIRAAAGCRIEVDDMRALKADLRPTPRYIPRVVEAHALFRVVTTDELHHVSFAEINSRNR